MWAPGAQNPELQSVADRIAPGQERRTRRGAQRLDVERVELDPLLDEAIDVGCVDEVGVVADGIPAHVVREEQDDVGPRGRTGIRLLRNDRRRWRGRTGRSQESAQGHGTVQLHSSR